MKINKLLAEVSGKLRLEKGSGAALYILFQHCR